MKCYLFLLCPFYDEKRTFVKCSVTVGNKITKFGEEATVTLPLRIFSCIRPLTYDIVQLVVQFTKRQLENGSIVPKMT